MSHSFEKKEFPAMIFRLRSRITALFGLVCTIVFIVAPTGGAEDMVKTPEFFLNLSLKFYQQGKFEKCIDAAKEALKLKPDYDPAYNNICSAYNELGQWEKGMAACERAIELNPGNQLAKNNLAWSRNLRDSGTFRGMWSEFWKVAYLKPYTFNFIDIPNIKNMPFVKLLYPIIFLLTICFALFLRPFSTQNFLRSFLLAYVIAAVFFAARMDYNWLMWWKKDVSQMSNLDPAGKFALLEADNVYGFAEDIKKLVPYNEGVRLFCGREEGINGGYERGKTWLFEGYYRSKIRYHLLPVKLSDAGNYIAVFMDKRFHMDSSSGSLKKDGEVIAKSVKLVKTFGNDSYLYKIEGKVNDNL